MRPLLLAAALAAVACGSSNNNGATTPLSFAKGPVYKTIVDGTTDDLLTGGVGQAGILSTTALPGFASASAPTGRELRKRAIVQNYRALVDTSSAAAGFGTVYGPTVGVTGGLPDGKIAGEEWMTYDDDGSGKQNVTMMVQLPSTFDKAHPCIVTATSSGSRGVYGAIGTAGEWGLKHGCAVAYTDKGSGNFVHVMDDTTVSLIDGSRLPAAEAGAYSGFTADVTDADRAALANRLAIKHAHSQQNPEKDWGLQTLHAIQFAFWAINTKYGGPFDKTNTITIASSVSNGGGAALAAAEQDTDGLISGVVVGEPQVTVAPSGLTIIDRGATQAAKAKPLEDYVTIANLYQPCAAQAAAAKAADMVQYANVLVTNNAAPNRCASLQAKGLLTSAAGDATAQANEALQKLHDAGWLAESDILHTSHFGLYATTAVAVTYANSYARANVKDKLCGYGYALTGTNEAPQPLSAAPVANQQAFAQLFGNGNGVPPTAPINLINENDATSPKRDQVSVTKSTGVADYNLDGALCVRALATGTDAVSGAALSGTALAQANTVKQSVKDLTRTGNLRGKPAILVQGRSDGLVPVNHASRAYYGANRLAEPGNAKVVYYEIENAQHFESFLSLPGFSNHFVPLHRYVVESLDLMYDYLRNGTPLPPSQVVRTVPRGSANLSTTTNVPPISTTPAAGGDQITFASGTLTLP